MAAALKYRATLSVVVLSVVIGLVTLLVLLFVKHDMKLWPGVVLFGSGLLLVLCCGLFLAFLVIDRRASVNRSYSTAAQLIHDRDREMRDLNTEQREER